LAGNIFTGGIAEALFGAQLHMLIDEKTCNGPPFCASNLIEYSEWLIKPEQNNGMWVADILWPMVNLNLQWIA
jgi:hypothetical protein